MVLNKKMIFFTVWYKFDQKNLLRTSQAFKIFDEVSPDNLIIGNIPWITQSINYVEIDIKSLAFFRSSKGFLENFYVIKARILLNNSFTSNHVSQLVIFIIKPMSFFFHNISHLPEQSAECLETFFAFHKIHFAAKAFAMVEWIIFHSFPKWEQARSGKIMNSPQISLIVKFHSITMCFFVTSSR